MNKLSILTIIIALNSCTSIMNNLKSVPSGDVHKDYITYSKESADKYIDYEKVSKALTRSTAMTAGITPTFIEITPHTIPLAISSAESQIKNEGYKENWSQEKIKQVRAQALEQKKLCFNISIKSSHYAAQKTKYWHGEVKGNDNKPIKLEFSPITGFSNTTRMLHTSANSAFVSSDTTYQLWTKACPQEEIKFTDNLVVTLGPRFDKALKPAEVSWNIKEKMPEPKKY